ncbi:MAG: heparinase II/III family protein [Candidatus Poribacteria bacterium]|nr:heparinase II/III family protein [Candidatus Poribacteria bacterium]
MKAPMVMTVCALLLIGASAYAAYPDLRGRDPEAQAQLRPRLSKIAADHPRIFFHESDLPELRRRIESVPEIAESYGWLTEWVAADHYYTNLWSTGNQLMAASVAYRLSEDPAALNLAVKIADYLVDAEGDFWTWPRIAKGLAFAYDWLYDDLTDDQKTRYAQAAIRNAKKNYGTWRHSDFNNHLYLEYGPNLYVGIALYGEGIDDEAAETFALDGLDLLVNHMMPAHELVNGGQGGWHESMSYHAFFTYEFAHLVELWQSATGEDLWSDFKGLDGEGHFQLYNTRPHDESWVAVADIHGSDSFSEANASYLALVGARRKDGVANYWVNHLRDEATRRKANGARYVRDGSSWWHYVVWYDPSVETITPEQLPTSRHFGGIGWASMRSDWTKDATFALFVNAPWWWGGHQHADANSFVIHKGGLLAVDSGVYEGTSHRGNYYARTIAHNAVVVIDPEEQFGAGTWGGGRAGQGANDGGQLYVGGLYGMSDLSDDAYRRGTYSTVVIEDDLTFLVGDATNAYSSHKVKKVERAFLYIKPNIFIVYDRIDTSDPDFETRWLLHTARMPEEILHTTPRAWRVANDNASLSVWTLLPRDGISRVIGGPGHEFEVNGVNYPPVEKTDFNPGAAGVARIEVVSNGDSTRHEFLHVLVLDDDEGAMSIKGSAGGTGDFRGARIVTASKTIYAAFSSTGKLTCRLDMGDGNPRTFE